MEIILASGSPRRRELMHYITDNFIVRTSDVDETVPAGMTPQETATHLAEKKAAAVAQFCGNNALVIGCDTLVFLEEEILGKPKDTADAKTMLKKLSGRTHGVVTGAALIQGARRKTFFQVTDVTFYPMTEAEIDAYIAGGEPMDKAGSYGIQGEGALFVREICGDYYNVVGLPIALLSREIKEFLGGDIDE